jgi:FkbM family methyltransferase
MGLSRGERLRVAKRVARRLTRAQDRQTGFDFWRVAHHAAAPGPGSVSISGQTIHYVDGQQLGWLFEEIFVNHAYAFDTAVGQPLVIDAGANIGLATLFFKRQHPNARVIAFEPNPSTFELLERNVGDLPGVTLVNAALAEGRGTLQLHQQAAGDIGASRFEDYRLIWHDKGTLTTVEVPTVPLSEYLHESVAFLKVDIEGSEGVALGEARGHLDQVAQIRMEYHQFPGQRLQDMLTLLDEAGFDYAIEAWKPDGTAAHVATCIIRAWHPAKDQGNA